MPNLPEGFVLDQPQGTASLPQGFQLDTEQTQQPQQPEQAGLAARTGRLALEAGKNLPMSTVNLLNNIGLAVMHPLDTAQTLGEIAFGGAQKYLIPGTQEDEQKFNSVADFFKERYGSLEGLNKSIAEDPAGVMADMSALATGAGGILKAAGATTGAAPLARAGQVATRVGEVTDPINIVATGAGKLVPSSVPEKLYSSATKMSTAQKLTPEMRAQNVKTGLELGITPDIKGLDKLRSNIDNLNFQINTILDNAAGAGETIPRGRIIKTLQELKKQRAFRETPDRAILYQAINKEIDKVRKTWGQQIPSRQVQDLKLGIYDNIRNAYGRRASVAKEIRKTTARGAKEALAERYPDLSNLNKTESAYLELEKAIEAAAKRIDNRDLIGIGIPLKTMTGTMVGGVEGGLGGIALGLLDSPMVKAKLSIALDRARKIGLKRNIPAYLTREAARQGGRALQLREE